MKKFKMIRELWLIFLLFTIARSSLSAQGVNQSESSVRPAFSFLLINPDPSAGGMGETGTAIVSNSDTWSSNYSKTVFSESRQGFSISYSPWMKSLANDIKLAYLSGFAKINEHSALIGSIRYLSLGTVELTDQNMQNIGTFKPNEFSADLGYAKQFGKEFALAITLRYINSGLRGNDLTSNTTYSEKDAIAAGISATYSHSGYLNGQQNTFSLGLDIANIGPSVKYSEQISEFLPTNLRIGISNEFMADPDVSILLALDINKLLVPSLSSETQSGLTNKKSVVQGIFNSFSDSSEGFTGEIREINGGIGVEIILKKRIKFRTGYAYEHPSMGYRRYLTVGTGFTVKKMNFDLGYIIADPSKNPFANTIRFGLGFSFGKY